MCPVLRRLTRDSEMAESHWFLPGPGQCGTAPPLRYAPPCAEADSCPARGPSMGSHGAMCGPPAARENFRAAARGIVRRSACNSLAQSDIYFPPRCERRHQGHLRGRPHGAAARAGGGRGDCDSIFSSNRVSRRWARLLVRPRSEPPPAPRISLQSSERERGVRGVPVLPL